MATKKNDIRKVYTTGSVARIFGVNINTVIKWFDEGKIEGFRLPGSNDRRIPVASLRRFMNENGIPLDLLGDDGPMRRMFDRALCEERVSFTLIDDKVYGPYTGRLADLSAGGAGLRTVGDEPLQLPPNPSRMAVEVEEGPLQGTRFPGRVAYLRPNEGITAIGVSFETMDIQSRERLMTYLDTRLG